MIEYCEFEPYEKGETRRLICPKCQHITRPTDLPLHMVSKICTPPPKLPWRWTDTFDKDTNFDAS